MKGKRLSNEERFAQIYDDASMLFDRECQLVEALGREVDLSSDTPNREISIFDNDVRIVIDGSFAEQVSGKYETCLYRVIVHYMIINEKYFHFCPDTVTVYSIGGEIIEVHPPYEKSEDPDFYID
ncbi:MAG: hypothetical protein MJZ16_06995 [Bacteroidales bacterium]|nr:hypothetical protein [Bacteroidales bacterium]